MKPLSPVELYSLIVEADVIDTTLTTNKPQAIVECFDVLNARDTLTDQQKRLLLECALMIGRHRFKRKDAEAEQVKMRLYSANPEFEWRPSKAQPASADAEIVSDDPIQD